MSYYGFRWESLIENAQNGQEVKSETNVRGVYSSPDKRDMRALMIDYHSQVLIGSGWEYRVRAAKVVTPERVSKSSGLEDVPTEEMLEELPPFNDLLNYFF